MARSVRKFFRPLVVNRQDCGSYTPSKKVENLPTLMASNANFVQYIVDQCSGAGDIVAKKMFGDYGIYCNGKIFGLICDNCFYVKPTMAGRALLRVEELRPPYECAKDYFYIADIDDRDYLSALVSATYKALPEPKNRKQ